MSILMVRVNCGLEFPSINNTCYWIQGTSMKSIDWQFEMRKEGCLELTIIRSDVEDNEKQNLDNRKDKQ